jgi:hypothetical protein
MALASTADECDRCTPDSMCFGHKAKTLVFGNPRTKRTREFKSPEGYRIKQTKTSSSKCSQPKHHVLS